MTITIETASLDERGRLVHDEDPVAQACLAFVHLERSLAERGCRLADIAGVQVLCVDTSIAEEVVEVVAERLRDGCSAATVEVSAISSMPVSGSLITLRTTVQPPPERHHEKEPR